MHLYVYNLDMVKNSYKLLIKRDGLMSDQRNRLVVTYIWCQLILIAFTYARSGLRYAKNNF